LQRWQQKYTVTTKQRKAAFDIANDASVKEFCIPERELTTYGLREPVCLIRRTLTDVFI